MSSEMRPELFAAARALVSDYLGYAPSDRLLLTVDTATDRHVIQAIMAAGIAAGGRPTVVTIPQLPYQGKLADPYLPDILAGAVSRSDVWIDLTFPYIAGSDLHDQAMRSNSIRYMLCSDMNAGGLQRMFGGLDFDRYFALQTGFDALIEGAQGKTVRITSALGTDVSFTLGKPHGSKPRRVDQPGMYMIPGSCTFPPEIESVKGRIVVETVFHEFYTRVAEPIGLEVDGRIRKVTGGGTERQVLERALKRAGGGDYGYVIHFTHGLHPAARFTGQCFVEDMRVIGSDAVGMGLPWWEPGGGENHPDAVMSMQSVWIDGRQVVADGVLVAPAELVAAEAALTPRHAA